MIEFKKINLNQVVFGNIVISFIPFLIYESDFLTLILYLLFILVLFYLSEIDWDISKRLKALLDNYNNYVFVIFFIGILFFLTFDHSDYLLTRVQNSEFYYFFMSILLIVSINLIYKISFFSKDFFEISYSNNLIKNFIFLNISAILFYTLSQYSTSESLTKTFVTSLSLFYICLLIYNCFKNKNEISFYMKLFLCFFLLSQLFIIYPFGLGAKFLIVSINIVFISIVYLSFVSDENNGPIQSTLTSSKIVGIYLVFSITVSPLSGLGFSFFKSIKNLIGFELFASAFLLLVSSFYLFYRVQLFLSRKFIFQKIDSFKNDDKRPYLLLCLIVLNFLLYK